MSRYASPFNRNTGKPREYVQKIGSRGGTHFWWTCSWTWRDGRAESCAHGEAESREQARQLAADHAVEVHGDEVAR